MLLDEAVGHTRTGDVWLFRGRSAADAAIRVATNAPVNHVGMAVVLDDMPPLMWHAELGRSLEDVWTGQHQRGVQLHLLHEAVRTWHDKYDQQAYLRQLHADVTPEMENAVLRTIAEMDGTPFPSVPSLATRWLKGRTGNRASLETVFCAEVVARTYLSMGLLPDDRPENWYDPGRFWSGDKLELTGDAQLRREIHVIVPPLPGAEGASTDEQSRLRRLAAAEWWREHGEQLRAERLAERLRSAAGSAAETARQAAERNRESSEAWQATQRFRERAEQAASDGDRSG